MKIEAEALLAEQGKFVVISVDSKSYSKIDIQKRAVSSSRLIITCLAYHSFSLRTTRVSCLDAFTSK
jgi:hypothetical protein